MHLTEEEVDYELALRGAYPIGSARVRANDLKERIVLATRGGAQPRLEMSPYPAADDLLASAVTYEEIRARLRDTNLTLVGYRGLRSRTIHLAERVDRIKPTTPAQVTATQELRSATHVLLEEVRSALDGNGPDDNDFDSGGELETDYQGAKADLSDLSLLEENERRQVKPKFQPSVHSEVNAPIACGPQIIITNPLDGSHQLQTVQEGSRIWNGKNWLVVGVEQPIQKPLSKVDVCDPPRPYRRGGDLLSRIKSLSMSVPDVNAMTQETDTSMRSLQSLGTKFSDASGRILGSTRKGEENVVPMRGLTGRRVDFCENNRLPPDLLGVRTVQNQQANRNSWHAQETHQGGGPHVVPQVTAINAPLTLGRQVPRLEAYTVHEVPKPSRPNAGAYTPNATMVRRDQFTVYQDENLNCQREPYRVVPTAEPYHAPSLPLTRNYSNYDSNTLYHTPEQPRHDGQHTAAPMRYEHRPRKPVPINQWKVSFSGGSSKDSLPVHDFLTQVEILSHAEGYSDSDLLSQIVHLLTGRARSWYQQAYFSIRSWHAFKAALKEKFLPPYYQFVVMAEIEARMQSRDEDVSTYIQDMERRFDRLPEQISESNKVFLVKKNLLSEIAVAIASFDVQSIRALEDICRRFESTKKIVSSNRNRQSNTQATGRFSRFTDRRDSSRRVTELHEESDGSDMSVSKGYDTDDSEEVFVLRRNRNFTKDKHDRRRSKSTNDKPSKQTTTEQMECHNCKKLGHSHRDCAEPQTRVFCYSCGKDGVRSDECSCKKGNRQANTAGDQVNSLEKKDPTRDQ